MGMKQQIPDNHLHRIRYRGLLQISQCRQKLLHHLLLLRRQSPVLLPDTQVIQEIIIPALIIRIVIHLRNISLILLQEQVNPEILMEMIL